MKNQPAESELTGDECKIVLKALGSYQILLYDKITRDDGNASQGSLREESDLVTSSIKKIHRKLEEFQKSIKAD
jgi:hypothetical protein